MGRQGGKIAQGEAEAVVLNPADKAQLIIPGFFLAAQGAVPQKGNCDRAGILADAEAQVFRHGAFIKKMPGAGGGGGGGQQEDQDSEENKESFQRRASFPEKDAEAGKAGLRG